MEKTLSSKAKHFASRYITDVTIEDSYVLLRDSSRGTYYIDVQNAEAISQFKTWLKDVFAKGVSGTLTVFEYSKHQIEGEIAYAIEHFVNVVPNANIIAG